MAAYPFYTSHKDDHLLTGSYRGGTCFFAAHIACEQVHPLDTARTERLTVSLSSFNGTITPDEVLRIARHCRDRLRPPWWPDHPTTAEIEIDGQAQPELLSLDPTH
jgi:hypothetical protein